MGKFIVHREKVIAFKVRNQICDALIGHPEAFQVMSVIMRYEDGYIKTLQGLKNILKCKRAYWEKASKVLKELGYMRTIEYNTNGRFDKDTYFHLEPIIEKKKKDAPAAHTKKVENPKKFIPTIENPKIIY